MVIRGNANLRPDRECRGPESAKADFAPLLPRIYSPALPGSIHILFGRSAGLLMAIVAIDTARSRSMNPRSNDPDQPITINRSRSNDPDRTIQVLRHQTG
jgi:hypothetical protein